ncbi:MAG: substrate-binding domain-containing protein, partial [Anaerolineae bacterium]|nr:substrate-binding domain-containing protein [Anaerolineae bacterium]
MSRSRIVFFVIILVAVGVIIASQVVRQLPAAPTATPQPSTEVRITVNPLAFDWVNAQVSAFNAQNTTIQGRPVRIRVESRDGVDIWSGRATPGTGWLAEATFAVTFAQENALNLRVVSPSIAKTLLIWGGFDRTLDSGANWNALQPVIVNGARTAFTFPPTSTAGIAVLLVAAADYSGSAQVSDDTLRDEAFRAWLRPVIESVQSFTSLGGQPAAAIATRGRSLGDFSLLPESTWLVNKVSERQNLKYAYPNYSVYFDMPFVVQQNAPDFEIAAVESFVRFLEGSDAQKA